MYNYLYSVTLMRFVCCRFTKMEWKLQVDSARLDKLSFTIRQYHCRSAKAGEHFRADHQPFTDYIVVREKCFLKPRSVVHTGDYSRRFRWL